ncbi:Protein RRP45A [Capsicum annuum]|nr:Protein RRP45A [Capsicum annuum]
MSTACSEIVWLCNLLAEIGFPQSNTTPLHADNTSEIQIATNAVYHERTEHIEVDCHYIRECVDKRVITLPHVREPLPLIIHHLPIAVTFAFIGEELMVIDPTHHEEAVMGGRMSVTLNANGDVCAIQKAGGHGVMQGVVMQCLRIASVKAGDITSKIKTVVESYKTERALRMVKRHAPSNAVDVNEPDQKAKQILEGQKLKSEECSVSQSDDMDVEQDRINKRSKKNRSFTGGPSSWDPYSEGVNTDELEATLASREIFKFVLTFSVDFGLSTQNRLSGSGTDSTPPPRPCRVDMVQHPSRRVRAI